MAIDTAAKRFSMMSLFVGFPLIPPDGTIGQADRQTLLGLYGGIPWTSGVWADLTEGSLAWTDLTEGSSSIWTDLTQNSLTWTDL